MFKEGEQLYTEKEIKEIYRRRRDIIVDSLNKIEGVTCSTPKGAIYAFAKLPVESSEDFCKWLLTEFVYDNSTVMLAPGEGFYETDIYGQMLEKLHTLFYPKVLSYYYDLTFEETVRRHQTRNKKADFSPADMKCWWKEFNRDFGNSLSY